MTAANPMQLRCARCGKGFWQMLDLSDHPCSVGPFRTSGATPNLITCSAARPQPRTRRDSKARKA